jgi:hypothetical protein
MKASLTLIAVLVVFFGVSPAVLAVEWKPADQGFSVQLPKVPDKPAATLDTDAGKLQKWMVNDSATGMIYTVEVIKHKEELKVVYRHDQVQANMAKYNRAELENLISGTTFTEPKAVTINGMDGMEIRSTDANGVARAVSFSTVNDSYLFLTMQTKPNPAAAQAFFNSIKITPVVREQGWKIYQEKGLQVQIPKNSESGGWGPPEEKIHAFQGVVDDIDYKVVIASSVKPLNSEELRNATLDSVAQNFMSSKFGSKEMQLIRNFEMNGHHGREYLITNKDDNKSKIVYVITPEKLYQFHATGAPAKLVEKSKHFFDSIQVAK